MINCIAVDDEPLALDLLADNISKIPYLNLVKKCRNAFEAMAVLNEQPIDLIFLDIQMAGLTGIQFLKTLTTAKPMVIFITAYEKYALEGYALDVVDYLMKPVALDRFVKACQKTKDLFDLKTVQNSNSQILKSSNSQLNTEGGYLDKNEAQTADAFFVNADYSLVKIEIVQILYVEGMKDYLKFYLVDQAKPVITRMSFKSLEEKLPENSFFRIQKSYLVNLSKIQSIRNGYVFIGEKAIPIGEGNKEELMKALKIE